MTDEDLFTAPWPGPGDSEGPVNPEPPVPGLGPEAGPLALIKINQWPRYSGNERAPMRECV